MHRHTHKLVYHLLVQLARPFPGPVRGEALRAHRDVPTLSSPAVQLHIKASQVHRHMPTQQGRRGSSNHLRVDMLFCSHAHSYTSLGPSCLDLLAEVDMRFSSSSA